MRGGGHSSGAPRTMGRTKEKQASQKMMNEALAAEALTSAPPPTALAHPEVEEAEQGEYEDVHHTKASVAQRRAERAERTADAGKTHKKPHTEEEDASDEEVPEYHYTRPKPRALTDALFMWERVAVFSEPAQVPEVERVSRDVNAHLKESNKGNNLMQRYWNAQWCRMVWKEEELPEEKRFLPPSQLNHSESKKPWKKVFAEEYPAFLDRTFQRKGLRNNDLNEAKVLFHVEKLNPTLTASQLQRMELTEEEARVKEQRKRGVEVEFEQTQENRAAGASGDGARPGLEETKHDHAAKEKGRPRAVQKDSYSRADYKEDYRTGARKGKHQKGGSNRWDNFDSYGDYDY